MKMFENAKVAPELVEKLSWFAKYAKPNMGETLGIEFLSFETGAVTASMPVNSSTHQPFGVLHGGASVAFAETLASFGGWLMVDGRKWTTVGVEINANHIRPVASGLVFGEAKCLHQGKTTQVWEIKITNQHQKLVCISRCTLAVIPIPKDFDKTAS